MTPPIPTTEHRGAQIALQAASTALATLRDDIRVSGPKPRQRFLIRRVNEALDTVKWHIDRERAARGSRR